MSSQTMPAQGVVARPSRRPIAAAAFGNFMEYIDFGSYGFLAVIIGKTFVGGESAAVQLLSSLAVFGVSFFFRPLGGAIFGYIGDKHGRKASMVWAVILMAISTGAIGLLPPSSRAGVLAPVLLVVCRAVQGLSIGGEYSGGSTYIIESAPVNHRGLWGSVMSWTAAGGALVGNALVLILTVSLSTPDMNGWGWRIPFLIAFPIGGVGLWMRLKVEDTEVYKHMKERSGGVVENPYRNMRWESIKAILLCIAFGGGTSFAYYYFATYFNTFLSATLGFSRPQALTIAFVSLTIYGCCTAISGWLSDKWGRKKMFVFGFFAFVVYGIPVFYIMKNGGFVGAFIAIVIFGMIESILNVLTVIVMPEVFPANTRTTGASIGYNIGVALIGGTGPFIAAFLVSRTGNPIAPGYYFSAFMLVLAIIVAVWLPETSGRNLHRMAARKGEVVETGAPEPEVPMHV